jgi:hypothetical protein
MCRCLTAATRVPGVIAAAYLCFVPAPLQGQWEDSGPAEASYHASALHDVAPTGRGIRNSGSSFGPAQISLAEIAAQRNRDVYSAIRLLRPLWLSTRGPNAPPVAVFLDGVRLEEPRALQGVSVNSVASIRRVNGIAGSQYGPALTSGAILIETR